MPRRKACTTDTETILSRSNARWELCSVFSREYIENWINDEDDGLGDGWEITGIAKCPTVPRHKHYIIEFSDDTDDDTDDVADDSDDDVVDDHVDDDDDDADDDDTDLAVPAVKKAAVRQFREKKEIREWSKYVEEQLFGAIEDGLIDKHLKMVALCCRNRYMTLHPEEFPGETPYIPASTSGGARPSQGGTVGKLDISVPDTRLILGGRNGDKLRPNARNVGDKGRMPSHSFRHQGNSYSKQELLGRRFYVPTTYKVKDGRRILGSLPRDTVWRVVEVMDTRFMAVPDMHTPQPPGANVALLGAAAKTARVFTWEYHADMLEQ